MMDKKTAQNDDLNAFREAMADVKPLEAQNEFIHPPQRRRYQKEHALDDEWENSFGFSDSELEMEVNREGTIRYCETSVRPTDFQKLRKGQMPVENSLDLHGFNIDEARETLAQFIDYVSLVNARCVRIIHGKGHHGDEDTPILKNHVNHWLRQHPNVLAFHSCPANDGGTGAVYVLMRRT